MQKCAFLNIKAESIDVGKVISKCSEILCSFSAFSKKVHRLREHVHVDWIKINEKCIH